VGRAGLRRALDDWTLPASSFVTSPAHVQQWILARLPDWEWVRQPPDAWLFPGFLPLILGAAALHGWRRPASQTDDRWLYAGIVLLSIWFAVGPPFGIWGWVHWLPGLSFVRVPSRFILLGILALAVLAAYGFERLARRLAPTRRAAAAGVAGLLLLGEFAAMPLDSRPYRIDIPAIDRWLDTQPKPFVVAEIPVPDSLMTPTRERRTTLYMLHSTAHFQPTVHGYSGIQPPGYRELYELLMVFPNEESLRVLHRMGVTYVVVHPDLWPPTDRPEAEARFEAFKEWLPIVHTIGEDRVHRIVVPGPER
jgi:hypothetical protein